VGQYNQKNLPTYQNYAMQKKGKEKTHAKLVRVFHVFHMPNLGVC
jgi:hypothetical protein